MGGTEIKFLFSLRLICTAQYILVFECSVKNKEKGTNFFFKEMEYHLKSSTSHFKIVYKDYSLRVGIYNCMNEKI